VTISTSQLVFTPDNATTAQAVTVTPIDDVVVNGTGAYTIRLKPAMSADENTADYHNRDATDITVSITDNENAEPPPDPAGNGETEGGQNP
jgi:hypothetical protein